ncbi:MAG: TMEM165/GDT1 family protein [Parvularculaceae bacterium]
MNTFLTVFATIFLAELGDKTQLATLIFATDGSRSKTTIFLAAVGALVASTVLAIMLGAAAERHLNALPLKLFAGAGFVVIGSIMIAEQFFKGA